MGWGGGGTHSPGAHSHCRYQALQIELFRWISSCCRSFRPLNIFHLGDMIRLPGTEQRYLGVGADPPTKRQASCTQPAQRHTQQGPRARRRDAAGGGVLQGGLSGPHPAFSAITHPSPASSFMPWSRCTHGQTPSVLGHVPEGWGLAELLCTDDALLACLAVTVTKSAGTQYAGGQDPGS